MRQLGNATNRLRAKNYNQENSGKVPQADSEPPPAGRPSENMDDFRQENAPTCVHRCPLTKPPSSPRDKNFVFVMKAVPVLSDKLRPACHPSTLRDEKYIFVKNGSPSELMLPELAPEQQADCRGRGFQFSSRDFPTSDGFPDPRLIAASFACL